MKEKAIIVDLDGTLADITVRRRHLEGKKKDWKNFNATIRTDIVHHWCRELICHMQPDYRILLVSGRIGTLKAETEAWLREHKVPYDFLYMRGEQDFRPDQILKAEMYEKYIEKKFDVLFVVDDRAKVVRMWRSKGLVVLQCDEGIF